MKKVATTTTIFPTNPVEYPHNNTHKGTSDENEEYSDAVII